MYVCHFQSLATTLIAKKEEKNVELAREKSCRISEGFDQFGTL